MRKSGNIPCIEWFPMEEVRTVSRSIRESIIIYEPTPTGGMFRDKKYF